MRDSQTGLKAIEAGVEIILKHRILLATIVRIKLQLKEVLLNSSLDVRRFASAVKTGFRKREFNHAINYLLELRLQQLLNASFNRSSRNRFSVEKRLIEGVFYASIVVPERIPVEHALEINEFVSFLNQVRETNR